MKNMTELRKELGNVFQDLRSGSIETKVASEMNNTAGKMINSTRVQLEYATQRGDKPSIPFLK